MTESAATTRTADRSWVALGGLTPEARTEAIRTRFASVAQLPPEARERQLQAMIEAEYELEGVELSDFTLLRLRALLALAEEDPEAAQLVARGYDAVFDRVPAEMAMRRAVTVQSVARVALRPEEVTGLRALIPSLLRQIPGR